MAAPAPLRAAARSSARKGTSTARPVRRTHAQRREQAEQRLLEAALGIVAQRGSIRMTLAEIGEAAGYSRGLPAHRFGSVMRIEPRCATIASAASSSRCSACSRRCAWVRRTGRAAAVGLRAGARVFAEPLAAMRVIRA